MNYGMQVGMTQTLENTLEKEVDYNYLSNFQETMNTQQKN